MLAGLTLACGSHEPDELRLLLTLAGPEAVVLDVGSNIGFYSIPLAAAGASVVAFEPSSDTRAWLTMNVSINSLSDRITIVPTAVSDHSGTSFLTRGNDGANYLTEATSDSEPVEVQSLDDWLAAQAPERVSILKIDAEGNDVEVMAGGQQLIAKHRPVILFEAWGDDARHEHVLGALGYLFVSVRAGTLVEAGSWGIQRSIIAIPTERLTDLQEAAKASMSIKLAVPKWERLSLGSRTSPSLGT